MTTPRSKWFALAYFSLSAALSQALWLNFAPLISVIQKKYLVNEDQAGLLLLVFPLIYIFISVHAGKFIDKKGYRKALILGGWIMAAFSCLRIYDDNFLSLLTAQIGIAIAQPFIINSISKLVLDWFPKEQEAIATGLGTIGMFIGMALGLMSTPYLIEYIDFQNTMIVFAAFSVVSAIMTTFFLRDYPIVTSKVERPTSHSSLPLKNILKDKNLIKIFTLSLLGLGFFNGLTTWIEPILAPKGITSIQAGVVGGMLVIGGIFGAAVIPAFSDYYKKRKPFLVGSIVFATATLWPLCHSGNFRLLFILGGLQGFFFLPAFSLLIQMCAEQVGDAQAGVATGILMLLGNAGGVIVILLMQAVKTDPAFTNGVYLMQFILILACILSFSMKETFSKFLKTSS